MRRWETERLLLGQRGPRDADSVSDYGRRSRAFHMAWDPLRPEDWWEAGVVAGRLATEIEDAKNDRSLVLYLTLRDDPRHVVGRIAVNHIVRGALQSCTVGYGLAPEATGRGLMTEALGAVVAIAFSDLDLHRVEANVIPRNVKSLAVVRRCGFESEGLSPRYIRIAGVWEDHLRFARIREER